MNIIYLLLFSIISNVLFAQSETKVSGNYRYIKGKFSKGTLKNFVNQRAKYFYEDINDTVKLDLYYNQFYILDGDTFNYIDENNKKQGDFIDIYICKDKMTKEFQMNKNCYFSKRILNYQNDTLKYVIYLGCDSNYNCDTISIEGDFSKELPAIITLKLFKDSLCLISLYKQDSFSDINKNRPFSGEIRNRYSNKLVSRTFYDNKFSFMTGLNYFYISEDTLMEITVLKSMEQYLIEFKDKIGNLKRRVFVYNKKIIKTECYDDSKLIPCDDKFDLIKILENNRVFEIY